MAETTNNQTHSSSTLHSIGVKKDTQGTLFIIDKPSQFRQKIPENAILIAPYFSNHWVHEIHRLSTIIVERGGQLSHSAIVARECGVPYFIIQAEQLKNLLQKYKQGDSLILNSSGDFIIN